MDLITRDLVGFVFVIDKYAQFLPAAVTTVDSNMKTTYEVTLHKFRL